MALAIFFIAMDSVVSRFVRCLRPVRLRGRDRKVSEYVPCGKCPVCRSVSASSWQSRLYHHISCGRYTSVFITLTYDNENLPLVNLNLDGDGTYTFDSFSSVKLPRRDSVSPELSRVSDSSFIDSSDFNEYLSHYSSSYLDETFPHFVLSHNELINYDKQPRFAVCYKKDIQDFVKRLRISISRNPSFFGLDTEVSYFICSEYGPKTYRPHYHGILFFRSPRIAVWAENRGVYECWRKQSLPVDSFGNRIASRVNNPHFAAAYISKYVTKPADLPVLLRYSAFSPFHLQSIKTPIGSFCLSSDDAVSRIEKGDILFHRSFIDPKTKERKNLRSSFPLVFWRTLFPQFLCHRFIDDTTFIRIIQRILCFRDISEFPDRRQRMIDSYGVSTKFKSYNVYQKHLHTARWLFEIAPRPTDYFRMPRFSNSVSIVTPSSVAYDVLLGGDLDDFIFGFDRNLCTAKKIWRILHSVSAFGFSPYVYLKYYRSYESRCFSDLYMKQVEFINIYPHLESFVYDFAPSPDIDNLMTDVYSYYYNKYLSEKNKKLHLFNSQLQL